MGTDVARGRSCPGIRRLLVYIMVAFSGSGPVPRRFWHLGAAAFLLTACATAPSAGSGDPSDAEAVDIGYGTVAKDQVVGSVSTLHGEDAQVGQFRTLADMLMRTPGVRVLDRPGVGLSVRIRTTNTSIVGGEEPLFVLDGMVIESTAGLAGLDPSTIRSITVLKDAGATAIYGSRGANGVILINTKR